MRKLFHHNRVGEAIEPCSAEGVRHRNSKKAEFRHLLIEMVREKFIPIKNFRLRANSVGCKTPRHRLNVAIGLRIIFRKDYHLIAFWHNLRCAELIDGTSKRALEKAVM